MKYTQDIRSLVFITFAWFFQLSVVFLVSPKVGFVTMAILFVVNLFFVFQVALINHNHRHLNIFEASFSNELVNHIISIIIFSPSTRLHTVHLLNHHTHYHDDTDWAGYRIIQGQPHGIFRALQFLMRSSLMMFKNRSSLSLTPDLRRQQTTERVVVYIYLGVLLLLNPTVVLIWLLPSCALGLYFLLFANLANHDLCDLESDLNHSRNFTDSFENWLFFNNGFHTAHHLKPALHWSKYPEYHSKQIAHQMDPALNEKSLFVFSIKQYVLPSSRIFRRSQPTIT